MTTPTLRSPRNSLTSLGYLLLIPALVSCGAGPEPGDQATSNTAAVESAEAGNSESRLSWAGRGQEPFWTLAINGLDTEFRQPGAGFASTADDVTIEAGPDGSTKATFIRNGSPYLIVTRTDETCIDGATGVPLPYSLAVQSGEQMLTGCGGTTEEYLAGEEPWVVEDVNGQGVVDRGEPRLTFASAGTVSLNSICREIAGTFSVNGPELTLNFDPVSEQGCDVPALKDQEDKILDLSSFPLSISTEAGEGLTLKYGQNGRILLRR